LDPAEGRKRFEEVKLEKQERDGVRLKGERYERAVEAFEKMFGKLEAGVIPKIPGWIHKLKYSESSGQTGVTYYDPEGRPYGTVKAVEAVFGDKLLQGGDVSCIDHAREEFIKEHGSLDPGYNPLRRSADGRSLQELVRSGESDKITEALAQSTVDEGKLNQRKRPSRMKPVVIRESDYRELTSLRIAKSSASSTSTKQLQQLLKKRGFQECDILTVGGESTGNRHVDEVSGSYFQLPKQFNKRPCFQWVKAVSEETRLVCAPIYVHWSSAKERWQVGVLGGDDNCVLFNTQDTSWPWDTENSCAPWKAIRSDLQ